jgi:hypothetical protein
MNTIKFLLLLVTIVSFMFFIMGLESLIESSNWKTIIIWCLINGILFFACRRFISIYQLYRYLNF